MNTLHVPMKAIRPCIALVAEFTTIDRFLVRFCVHRQSLFIWKWLQAKAAHMLTEVFLFSVVYLKVTGEITVAAEHLLANLTLRYDVTGQGFFFLDITTQMVLLDVLDKVTLTSEAFLAKLTLHERIFLYQWIHDPDASRQGRRTGFQLWGNGLRVILIILLLPLLCGSASGVHEEIVDRA